MSTLHPSHIFDIIPSDTEVIPMTQYIMVGAPGDVAVETTTGKQRVMPKLQPGAQYAIAAQKILATGTTVAGIVGFL